ncbi:hypothetical protein GGI07_001316 [Coemansia sp. Benny D115]|nr:hypothetical protein GGI07_001316 [Coemansia sp. Benny D115]
MSDSQAPPVPSRKEHSNNIDYPEERGTFCNDLRKAMFDSCPEVWANYFEQLRAMKKQKEKFYSNATK